MPVYEYEHVKDPCSLGRQFELRQSVDDPTLENCPECGKPVRKLLSLVGISVPKSNGELRDMGFTKLVKRDDGIYENVTARDGDSKYMERDKPETIPDISKTISD